MQHKIISAASSPVSVSPNSPRSPVAKFAIIQKKQESGPTPFHVLERLNRSQLVEEIDKLNRLLTRANTRENLWAQEGKKLESDNVKLNSLVPELEKSVNSLTQLNGDLQLVVKKQVDEIEYLSLIN